MVPVGRLTFAVVMALATSSMPMPYATASWRGFKSIRAA